MELELSKLKKQRLINSLEFGAVSSYYNLINANEMLNAKKQSLEIAKENLNSVKLKYDLGSVSKAEVEAAEFAVNKTEIEIDTLKRSVEFSRLSFNNMIGMKNDEYYILSDKLEITEPENIDLDECIKSALENRFEMIAARLSLSLAEKEAECYGAFYTKQTYFYKLKEHNVEMRKAELENAEKNIILAIKKSYFDYLDSYNNILLSNIAVRNAELAYNMAKSMFEAGAGTNQEVIKAQNDLDLARLQKVQAQTAYFLSKLTFDNSLNVGIDTN
jgi:outer membrane protein